jgi:carbonic anhydrase
MRPTLRTFIISCADPRVDPVHILGLEPGEAVVLRNVGGRAVPGTLQLLRMLIQVPPGPTGATPSGGNPGSPFHLILLQHTDCGITRLASNTEMMSNYFGISSAELPAKAIADPRAAVTADVAALRALNGLPDAILISGLVYDTETGLVDIVVPPTPRRPAAT